jgi:hypothetical protein
VGAVINDSELLGEVLDLCERFLKLPKAKRDRFDALFERLEGEGAWEVAKAEIARVEAEE